MAAQFVEKKYYLLTAHTMVILFIWLEIITLKLNEN